VCKIDAPYQPELALGAVAGDSVWLNEPLISSMGLSRAAVDRTVARESAEAARREILYRLDRPPVSIAGRTVVVVDDGLATGATASAAIRALGRRGPARIIFAAPVCSVEGAAMVGQEADAVVCLTEPTDFYAVSQVYGSFSQVSDEEVRQALDTSHSEGVGVRSLPARLTETALPGVFPPRSSRPTPC